MSAAMMNATALLKTDATRRIDWVIDCSGAGRSSEDPPSAVRRSTWLTRGRSTPSLPTVFLEHPLATETRRSQGA
jgi:hypothetical protein